MIALPLLAFFAVDFSTQVKPVLDQKCVACHDRAFYLRKKDKLVATINLPATAKNAMPPGGPQLSAKDRATLTAWVAEGMVFPVASKALADDLGLTKILHAQILKVSKERNAAAMKPYKAIIPGTDVPYEMVPCSLSFPILPPV